MNIYESMNKAFEAELSKIDAKKQKLTESVEVKEEVEFKPIEIPAVFAKYYRTLQPGEYKDIVGFPYEEMTGTAAEYGVDEMQYIIANDDYQAGLADNGLEVLAVYKDGNNIGIGQEVGGRLYPVDLEEVTACLKENMNESQEDKSLENLLQKYPELKLDSTVKPLNEDNPYEKLKKAYPDLENSAPSEKAETKYPPIKKSDATPGSPLDKLITKYPELMEESMDEDDDDLWSEIYGELTMDGKQVMSDTGKSTKFNIGAGYDYNSQIHVCDDGAIRVEADTLEELKPAADIAMAHKAEGVSYRMRRCKKGENFNYCIEICIPFEDVTECLDSKSLEEEDCTDAPMEEAVKNEDLSPIEKLKKAYPELNI